MRRIFSETRHEYHLTQEALATLLGVTNQAVSQYEGGEKEPTNRRLLSWIENADRRVCRLGLELFFARYRALVYAVLAPNDKE